MTKQSTLTSLTSLVFSADFVGSLPGDPHARVIPRQVRNACYSLVQPTPVRQPRLLGWSDSLGATLGLSRPRADDHHAAAILAGNQFLAGMQPYASRYGGYQFGHWAGQLGDGRAITLGECRDSEGRSWEMQLKGAGPSPYSRSADGRAVLRSSLREFLCSEAMHHLGVPTTRALSLVSTGDAVVRDMFYDGHPTREPGAIVCRMAPSFIRFGHFEILAACKEHELLRQLVDFTISRHFPECGPPGRETYAPWFAEVCARTALMVAHWQRVGFVHGVMNTDNMSILGLTIDYGPYGWLEGYDPAWTPNTTDAERRRYAFGNQPQIALWNLARLGEALRPCFIEAGLGEETLVAGLDHYCTYFNRSHREMSAAKLGLSHLDLDGDDALLEDLLALLQAVETDMTLFYRQLAKVSLSMESVEASARELMHAACFEPRAGESAAHIARLVQWLQRYILRVQSDSLSPHKRQLRMNQANPQFVLRNYLAQQAIDAALQDDTRELATLLGVFERPYAEQPTYSAYAQKRPEWARHKPGCSTLSCSS